MENYFNYTNQHRKIIRKLKEMNLYGDLILEIRKEQFNFPFLVKNIYQIVSYCILCQNTPQGRSYWEDIESILSRYRYGAFYD